MSSIVTGIDAARQMVAEFLEKTRSKHPHQNQNMGVSLYQIGLGAGSGSEPIQGFELEADDPDINALATDILDYAEKCAEEVGPGYERVTFTVQFDGIPKQRTFSLRFVDEDEDDSGQIDPFGGPAPVASQAGVVGMLMQHTQVFAKEMVSQATDSYRMLQRENNELRRENAEYRRERLKFLGLWEEMQQRKFERELAAKDAETTNRMKEAAFSKLAPLAIPLLNSIAGKRVIQAPDGEPESAAEATIVSIFDKLSDDQMQKLALSGILEQEQLLEIMSLAQAIREQKARMAAQAEKEKQQAHASANGV